MSVRLGVEICDREHAPDQRARTIGVERARERPNGPGVLLRVEVGDAQRVLRLGKIGVGRDGLIEELGGPCKSLLLRVHHAKVQVRAGERRARPTPNAGALFRRETGQRRDIEGGRRGDQVGGILSVGEILSEALALGGGQVGGEAFGFGEMRCSVLPRPRPL